MNAKIVVHPSEFSCSKCGSTQHPIDRHHVKHQKLFVTQFGISDKARTARYATFRARYEEFNPKDIRLLCRDCHGEIHEEYLYLMLDEKLLKNKSIYEFSWKDAAKLMNKFEKFFNKWINE